MFLRCSPRCTSKVPPVHTKGVEQGSRPRAKKGSFGDKEAGTSGDSGAGGGLLIPRPPAPARLGGLSLHTLLGKTSWRTRHTSPAWAISGGLSPASGLSPERPERRYASDQRPHNTAPFVPSNTEKRSNQTLRVAPKPGASWCPKFPLSLPEIPSSARAPPSAPAQFLAHCPGPGT